MYTMVCGDTYCLITGDNKPGMMPESILLKYDGTDFTDLTEYLTDIFLYGITVSKGDEGEWLIAFHGHSTYSDETEIAANELVMYDGTSFEKMADLPDQFYTYAMGHNREYWLLTNSQQLLKYEGGQLTDLTDNIDVTWKDSGCEEIQWVDECWMITMGGHLLTYDGDTFTEIEIGVNVEAIEWNSEYWLIGGDSTLQRYDGSSFTDLTDEYLNAGNVSAHSGLPYYIFGVVVSLAFIIGIFWKKRLNK
ncbi:MAG: hypothetical protein ACXQS3_00750 [Candidatus Methanofastidiosia archaeon]